jgi:hypothetical protein
MKNNLLNCTLLATLLLIGQNQIIAQSCATVRTPTDVQVAVGASAGPITGTVNGAEMYDVCVTFDIGCQEGRVCDTDGVYWEVGFYSQTSQQKASGGSISYHTIIVGPDGVVQEEKVEKNLEGDIFKNKQMLKGLPEQVRQQVEAAINKAGQNRGMQIKVDAGKNPGIMSPKTGLSSLLKDAASDLPADMRKQLMEAMKGIDASGMNVGNIQARAIVIGPDGKKQEYSFGSEQKNTPSTKEPLATKKGNTKKTPSADANVMDALNRILDRLDKIEGELKMLKNPNQ